MADIVIKLDVLSDAIKETKAKQEEIESRIDIQSDSINSIDQWRKGNGAKGAEGRLQCVEGSLFELQTERLPARMSLAEADIQALQKIADGKIETVVRSALDARDRTVIAYIKAFGPYAATIAAIIAALWGKI
jgi:hypothetical protein